MYLVYANRVGFEDGVGFWGGSEILGPFRRSAGARPLLRARHDRRRDHAGGGAPQAHRRADAARREPRPHHQRADAHSRPRRRERRRPPIGKAPGREAPCGPGAAAEPVTHQGAEDDTPPLTTRHERARPRIRGSGDPDQHTGSAPDPRRLHRQRGAQGRRRAGRGRVVGRSRFEPRGVSRRRGARRRRTFSAPHAVPHVESGEPRARRAGCARARHRDADDRDHAADRRLFRALRRTRRRSGAATRWRASA